MNAAAPILQITTDFPPDWPVRAAAYFAPFITSGSRGWAKYYAETGDLFMRITNLGRSSIYPDLSDRQHVALPGLEREGLRTGLRTGDILISITADIGIIGYVDDRLPLPAYINQHVACLRLPPDQVCPKFVAYYLASAEPQKRFIELTDVGAKTGINLSTVSKLTFPCPPLREQQAIAAALSDADGVVAELERVVAKKRLIKQGAMQDLLTGSRRLPGFSAEWDEATIVNAAHVDPEALGAGTPKDYSFRYISLEDVNQGVLSGWADVVFGSAPSRARRILRKDDVLLGTVRPNLRSHMLFDCAGEDWIGSTGFAVLRPRTEKCVPGYLFELIMSDVIGRQIDEVIAGSNYPAISNSDVRKLEVMLPSIGEQQAIAGVLRDMDAEIQTLESRLTKARAVKEGMMQNLLTGRVRLI